MSNIQKRSHWLCCLSGMESSKKLRIDLSVNALTSDSKQNAQQRTVKENTDQ